MVLANGEKVVKNWKWAVGSNYEEEDNANSKKKNKKQPATNTKYGEVVSHNLVVTNKRVIATSIRKYHGRNGDELQTTYRDYPVKDIKEVYASHKVEKFTFEPRSTKGATIACIIFAVLAVVSAVFFIALLPVCAIISLLCLAKIRKIKKMNENPKKAEADFWIEFERIYEGSRNTLQFGTKDSKIVDKIGLKANAEVAKEIVESIGAVIIVAKEME